MHLKKSAPAALAPVLALCALAAALALSTPAPASPWNPTPQDADLCTPAWLAGGRVAAPDLSASLALERLEAEDPSVRRQAVAALAARGDAAAVVPLIHRLREDDSGKVRAAAADALGRLGDHRATEPLLAALEEGDPRLRQMALRALGRLGDPRAAEKVATALVDSDNGKNERQEAAWALGNLPGEAATLRAALDDPVAHVRQAAACSLGKVGDDRSRASLRQATADEDAFVRAAAHWALERLAERS